MLAEQLFANGERILYLTKDPQLLFAHFRSVFVDYMERKREPEEELPIAILDEKETTQFIEDMTITNGAYDHESVRRYYTPDGKLFAFSFLYPRLGVRQATFVKTSRRDSVDADPTSFTSWCAAIIMMEGSAKKTAAEGGAPGLNPDPNPDGHDLSVVDKVLLIWQRAQGMMRNKLARLSTQDDPVEQVQELGRNAEVEEGRRMEDETVRQQENYVLNQFLTKQAKKNR